MGDGVFAKVRACFLLPLISLCSPIVIKMRKFGKRFDARFESGEDVAMFVEVFYDEEYRLPDSLHPTRII